MYILFETAHVQALCGGQFPTANGFAWDQVEHFRLEDGVLQPYRGNEILPGLTLEVKITAHPEWPKKILYRVMASHCEDPEEKDTEFRAQSDNEAWTKFEELAQKPQYGMDYLRLVRVDAVEEVTHLGSAERKNGIEKPPTLHRVR